MTVRLAIYILNKKANIRKKTHTMCIGQERAVASSDFCDYPPQNLIGYLPNGIFFGF